MTISKPEKRTIGRIDKADFPELELKQIDIKIDSGAYTSSIHCDDIEERTIEGNTCICFKLLDSSHPEYNNKRYTFKNYRKKMVKNSFGVSEERYMITTTIELFDEIYSSEFTLSERGEMKYPVLIGRKLLNKKFIIDPGRTNLSYKYKLKKEKKK